MKLLLPAMYTLLISKSIFFFNDTKESQFKNNTEIKVSKVPVKENIKTLQRYLMALKQEWKNEEEL